MNTRRISQSIKMLSLCIMLFIATALQAQIPFDPQSTTGKLSNGLTYYIRPNAKPENKVELRLVVNAGSILEDNDQLGLAHFCEHMLFNGTKRYPKNELVDFLQSIGVSFGADLNAYTSFDETVYMLSIPTDKEGNLEKGFEVLEDWAAYALFDNQEIDKERGVVLEESRGGKGADDRMEQKYLPKMFAGSRYADRLPIGKDEIIKTADYDAAKRFYRDWYRPDLMAVVVVGDISMEKGIELVKKHFEHLKNPAKSRERRTYDIPPYKEATAMVLSDVEATDYDFSFYLSSRKSEDPSSLETYRISIVRNLISSVLGKRLYELTQGANPPFIYSWSGIGSGYARGYEGFYLYARVSDNIESAVNAAISELTRLREFGVTKSELQLAKNQTLNYIEKSYNERNTTESWRIINEYVRHFLEGEPLPGIEYEYKAYQRILPEITLGEINAEINNWLAKDKTQQFFTMATGPQSRAAQMPDEAKLLALVKAAQDNKVEPKAEKHIAEALLDNEPKSGKILSEVNDGQLGAITYTLSNGVKVTVKSTTLKSDEIILRGIKKGGTSNYEAKDRSNAQYCTSAIGAMGFGSLTPTQLADFLTGKTASLSVNIAQANVAFYGSSSIKDFETMLQLMHLKMTAVRKDEELFKGYISKQKAQLEFLMSNPQTAFRDSVNKVLYNNDPRMEIAVPTVENYSAIKLDRAIEIYKSEVCNSDGLHVFIVGNTDQVNIKSLLEKYIASLPALGKAPTYKDNGLRPIAGKHELNVKKGIEPKSLIMSRYYGEAPYSKDFALKSGLLAEVLNLKVIEEFREKMSAIYGGGFGASVNEVPYQNYSLQLYLPCGPENVQPLIKAAEQEIDRILQNGVESRDLEKAKLSKIEEHKEAIQANYYWANSLQEILFWNRDRKYALEYEDLINNITPSDLKETAQIIFGRETNYLRAVLNPEDKE